MEGWTVAMLLSFQPSNLPTFHPGSAPHPRTAPPHLRHGPYPRRRFRCRSSTTRCSAIPIRPAASCFQRRPNLLCHALHRAKNDRPSSLMAGGCGFTHRAHRRGQVIRSAIPAPERPAQLIGQFVERPRERYDARYVRVDSLADGPCRRDRAQAARDGSAVLRRDGVDPRPGWAGAGASRS